MLETGTGARLQHVFNVLNFILRFWLIILFFDTPSNSVLINR